MTYAITHMGSFFLLLLLLLLLRTPLPQPPGPYLSLEAHIPASRPKSQSWGSNKDSIGHRPLWGRCPSNYLTPSYTHIGATGTADHRTLWRLFISHSLLSCLPLFIYIQLFIHSFFQLFIFLSLKMFYHLFLIGEAHVSAMVFFHWHSDETASYKEIRENGGSCHFWQYSRLGAWSILSPYGHFFSSEYCVTPGHNIHLGPRTQKNFLVLVALLLCIKSPFRIYVEVYINLLCVDSDYLTKENVSEGIYDDVLHLK